MQDINYISLDVSEGWLDVLIDIINDNSQALPENKANNDALIAKITKYKRSDGTIRIYRSEYEALFYILLNNHVLQTKKINEALDLNIQAHNGLVRLFDIVISQLEVNCEEETRDE